MEKKQSRRNGKKLNLLKLVDGVYFDERGFGEVHLMNENESIFGVKEYVYKGYIHKGRCGFVSGKKLAVKIPCKEEWNHGYTLEGAAQDIFKVDNALCIRNGMEKRTFCYINSKSVFKFVGDPNVQYALYVRFYENCYGVENNRWVVIWAEEVK
ncbi:MAG: hypothetical protein WCR56_02500 [Bacilli bacterium]|mgnify:CR=1 FL=1|jgi:hypothetical protein